MFSPASVCEQLPDANSSPIVTKLCHHALGHRDEVIKYWKVKVKGQGRWGGMHSTERPSSYHCYLLCICVIDDSALLLCVNICNKYVLCVMKD